MESLNVLSYDWIALRAAWGASYIPAMEGS